VIGKGREHVASRHYPCRCGDALGLARQLVHQRRIELPVAGDSPLLGGQYLALKFFELGGDKAFGVGEGLAPVVIVRDPVQIALADLDEVAEDLVVPHLERRNPGTFALSRLDAGEQLFAAAGQAALLVELLVPTIGHDAGPRHYRRFSRQPSVKGLGDVGHRIEALGQKAQARRSGRRQGFVDSRQEIETGTNRLQLARIRQPEADPRRQPFEIRDVFERAAHLVEKARIVDQFCHRPMPFADFVEIDGGSQKAVAEQAGAHSGLGVVKNVHQGALATAVGRPLELQIADRGAIDDQRVAGLAPDEGPDMIEPTFLRAFHIADQGAGHSYQGLAGLEAESVQRAHPKGPPEAVLTGRGRELFVGDRGDNRLRQLGRPHVVPSVPVFGHQHLARSESGEVLG
jgi:hypothetical protein